MAERPFHAASALMDRGEHLRVSALVERRGGGFEVGRRPVREPRRGRHVGDRDQQLRQFAIGSWGRVELHGKLERREVIRLGSPLGRLIGDFEQRCPRRSEIVRGQGVMGASGGSECLGTGQRTMDFAPIDREELLLDRAGNQLVPDLEGAILGLDHEAVLDGLVHACAQVRIESIRSATRKGRRATWKRVG